MLTELTNRFKNANNILIILHESPDGDAVASALALADILRGTSKQVECACYDALPKVFTFLPGAETIKTDFLLGDYDLICTVDCGDAARTGFAQRLLALSASRSNIVNIDHHCRNDLHKIASVNYVDESASASAELIYRIGEKLNHRITRDYATLILTGLYTDTGGFQHSNTSPTIYRLASKLLSRGARLNTIASNIALNRSVVSLKLWGIAFSRIWQNKYGIAISYITGEDLKEVGATNDDLAGAINIINCVPSAKAAILFAELPNGQIRASIRTENNNIDVSALARLFGGGGHKKAAGFTILGKMILDGGRLSIDEFGA